MSNLADATTVRVGIYQNSPKVFIDDKGTPGGIFVDIVNEIARKEKWKIDYVYGTWTENIHHLERNEIDLLVDVSFSVERAKKFNLSNTPVLESWLDVYSKKEDRIGSISDLNMKKIAVLKGSIQEKYLLEEIKTTFNIDFTLLPYADYPSSVKAVQSGEADVMVATRFFSFSPLRDEDIVPSHVIFRPENLHFAFPKNGNTDLMKIIDSNVASMKNNPNSAYYQSLTRWLNIQPRTLIPNHIKYALAIITGLLAIIGLFAFFLKQQVNAKTKALRETDRLLKETQAIASLGGWEYDVKKHRIKWTDEMYQIYGVGHDYDPNKMIQDISFYTPQSAPIIKDAFRQAMEVGKPFDLELELLRADGKRIWVRTMSQPVMENGKVIRVTGNILDITKSKLAEEEIRQLNEGLEQRISERTAQLEESNKELEAFSYSVSHDLRSPLRAIDGFTRILLEDFEPHLNTEGKRICSVICENTSKMGQLIDDLLTFSRLGRTEMQPSQIDMSEMANLVFQDLTTPESREHIDFQVGDLPAALGDPSFMRQAWMNLLSNAIKFSSKRERSIIKVSGEQREGKSVYSVQDNGAGFDMQYVNKLFSVFQRLHSDREFEGTGVGLAIVQRIVKRHGGRVWGEGKIDGGATFYFTLPQEGV